MNCYQFQKNKKLIDGNQVIDIFNTNPYAISSMTVLPIHVAPALKSDKTAGAVDVAAGWVLAQSGFPNPVTYPSTSYLFPNKKLKRQISYTHTLQSADQHTHIQKKKNLLLILLSTHKITNNRWHWCRSLHTQLKNIDTQTSNFKRAWLKPIVKIQKRLSHSEYYCTWFSRTNTLQNKKLEKAQ